jgi:zinc D-Ala-D-Ala carboxypeptidase
MELSRNLSLVEVTKSATAIKHGIANEPTIEHLLNLKELATNVFQPIREHFAVPVGISSGYRSEALNDLIGGSSRSQHSKGEALDIDADIYGGITNKQIFEFIKDRLDFDQLIWEFGTDEEPAWVHVSYKSSGNRREILKAIKVNGRTQYVRM